MGYKRPPQFQNSSKTYLTSIDITGATQSALMDKISAFEAIADRSRVGILRTAFFIFTPQKYFTLLFILI